MAIYLLKDLAYLSGQSVHTLKFYLKVGVITETGRTPKTNFRYFDDMTLQALSKIRVLRRKHIPLNKIKGMLKSEARQ
ncbi:MAG: MerR family transcriptional regulator [Candidatus Omnitrophota bacterium]